MTLSHVRMTVLKYKWPLALVVVGSFLFYWYEIRPIRTYRFCAAQASFDAKKLLASKAQISKGTEQGKAYASMVSKSMYLRSDYVAFLDKCLMYYGMRITTENQNVAKESADTAKAEGTKTK